VFALRGRASELLVDRSVAAVHLTMSHTARTAAAVVVLT
jgi:phosphopantetheinyl transferase (holo-ACP synthase)